MRVEVELVRGLRVLGCVSKGVLKVTDVFDRGLRGVQMWFIRGYGVFGFVS